MRIENFDGWMKLTEAKAPRTAEEVSAMVSKLRKLRKKLPSHSAFGDPNHEAIKDDDMNQAEVEKELKEGHILLCRGFVESFVKSAKMPKHNKILIDAVNQVKKRMKNFFINLYTQITSSTLGAILFAAGVIGTFFTLALVPTMVYFGNSKYFGDHDDTYWYLPIISICVVGAAILGVFIWLIYNTFKKN
jgi:hypothetical protein